MSLPVWKGLFEYSMKHHDGTKPSNFKPEDIDPEKMKWLGEVLKSYMLNFADRMKEIKTALDTPLPGLEDMVTASPDEEGGSAAVCLERREVLLEELMDIVSSIDNARDLNTIGGLPTLLDLLAGPHPSLRWRTAEVVATCVANNPPVQQWFLEGGVLPKLLPLLSPTSSPVEATKALLAVSGLIRQYPEGLQAFRDADGLQHLIRLLGPAESSQSEAEGSTSQNGSSSGPDPRVLRKALNVLQYVCSCSGADCVAMTAPEPLARLTSLLRSDDSDVREGALRVLLELGASSSSWPALSHPDSGVSDALSALHRSHSTLSGEDLEAVADEVELRGELAAVLVGQPPVNSCRAERDAIAEAAATAAAAAGATAASAAAARAFALKQAIAAAVSEHEAGEAGGGEGPTAGQPQGTVYVNGVAVGGEDSHESYGSMQLGMPVSSSDIM